MTRSLPHYAAHDQNVRIRPWHPDDIAPFLEAVQASHAELSEWLPWCHADFGWADASAYVLSRSTAWREGLEYSFAIEEASGERRLLGDVVLTDVCSMHRRANVGYWVRSDATGAGVATRAVRLLAAFAFRHLDLERLEVLVEPENAASARVAVRVGAEEEGRLRRRIRRGGRSHDAVLYALLNPFSAG